MSVVSAAAQRSISSDTFDDLLPEGVAVQSIRPDGSMLTVTFTDDLDAATEQTVRDRMTTRDDADQAARANLADLRSALDAADLPPELEPIRALVVALADYTLGV